MCRPFEGSKLKNSYLLDNSAQPVIIIDEPHRAGGEQTKKFLPHFSAQLVFRFGATYKTDNKGKDYAI